MATNENAKKFSSSRAVIIIIIILIIIIIIIIIKNVLIGAFKNLSDNDNKIKDVYVYEKKEKIYKDIYMNKNILPILL